MSSAGRMSTRRGRPLPAPIPPTRPVLLFYGFARRVVVGLALALWRTTVEGREHVPSRGPFVIAPVHRNNIDTILVGFVTRLRPGYLAKDTLWKWRPAGVLFSALGGFPVRRDVPDREALRHSLSILESGQPLVVFPEGTRRSGPVVGELHEGAAYLALRTGAPIVPVGIAGSEDAWPRGRVLPRRGKVHIVIGPPIEPPRVGGERVPRRAVRELTETLREELQELFDKAQAGAGWPYGRVRTEAS
jgi:1-acyl-sn-glycerol-3-phosphate acyltransferase